MSYSDATSGTVKTSTTAGEASSAREAGGRSICVGVSPRCVEEDVEEGRIVKAAGGCAVVKVKSVLGGKNVHRKRWEEQGAPRPIALRLCESSMRQPVLK